MVIGIANNLYPPFGLDSGAEIIAQQMAETLRQQGHEVFVISTKPKKSARPQTQDLYWLNSRYEMLAEMNIIQPYLHNSPIHVPSNFAGKCFFCFHQSLVQARGIAIRQYI